MSDTGERTEKPSGKRLADARNRGQVPRSRDLSIGVSSMAMTLALGWFGPRMAERLADHVASGIRRIGDHPLATVNATELQALVVRDGGVMLAVVGPLLGVAAVIGVATFVAPSGFVVATEALKLNWSKLSPAQGFRRLAPKQSGIDLLKAVIAVILITTVAWQVVSAVIADAPMLAWMAPADAARSGWSQVLRLMWQAALCGVVVGVGDYGVQFWRNRSSLKMTKQELKEEHRMQEGSPEVKGRVRRIQREMTKRRMLAAVKTATVVITNPTHYAVALEYRRFAMAAPVVVAKGADHLAARIRAEARDHGVPMVENVSLAQALYRGAEVGDAIPPALFGAVAEVLAYLVRIRQLML